MIELILKNNKIPLYKGYENVNLKTCVFFLNKFSKSIRALLMSFSKTVLEKETSFSSLSLSAFPSELIDKKVQQVLNEKLDDILIIQGFPQKKYPLLYLKQEIIYSLYPEGNIYVSY